jgi:uncharacterized protein (TIGR00255 family)
MAVMSMTGFGRSRGRLSDRFDASMIVRSVNHRYLDIQVRTNLREEMPEVESDVRSVISERIRRGRVTAQVNLERLRAPEVEVIVNAEAVGAVIEQLAGIPLPDGIGATASMGDVLAVPGLITVAAPETMLDDEESGALRRVAAEAVAAAAAMRQAEGERLSVQIEAELSAVAAFAEWFEPQMSELRNRTLARTKERIAAMLETEGSIDPDRLVQEAALLADRADVAEEIVRLRAHLETFSERLSVGGVVGRALDFLCQEIHRELNTLGSKCREPGVAERLVDAKTAAERVREQVQNLE